MQSVMLKPEWLRITPPKEKFHEVKRIISSHSLNTVCQQAHCPNMSECWSSGTATFMLMGDTCTRGCRFCAVKSGRPGELDETEPRRLAEAIKELGIFDYVVLTSVNRDDLEDQGAAHFASCIREVKRQYPGIKVEVLIPDFQGKEELLSMIVDAAPDVIAHNLETVERLQNRVRDYRANYEQSLSVLENVKKLNPGIYTKTSLMLGLGEQDSEIMRAMDDLREADVNIITFGQYLRPSEKHIAVKEYVKPEKFKYFEKAANSRGFLYCASGPFVRSSYKAGELFLLGKNGQKSHREV